MGLNCALYHPTLKRISGGTADALDSIQTDTLPAGFWVSFFDDNEITQSGFLNFRLTIGTVPGGSAVPEIVVPLDHAQSGAYWRKG